MISGITGMTISIMILLRISAICVDSAGTVRPRKLVLVSTPPVILSYHDGPLLTKPQLRLHVLWYGSFSPAQQAIVSDFLLSLHMKSPKNSHVPTPAKWWRTASAYKDNSNTGVSGRVKPGKISKDLSYSMGKTLSNDDISVLVERAVGIGSLPRNTDGSSVYIVITAEDVVVGDFCMASCGFHASASNSTLPFLWVGNPATQCPGLCAWPYAVPEYGPPGPALVSPNGDVGMEGVIINLATLLAGITTNPFHNGYYEGNASDPAEAVTACPGIFASGAYPGYPGNLLQDAAINNASYNSIGVNGHMFLLPAMWNPSQLTCHTII